MKCLGPLVAALVDGELPHATRERAQAHLAHCTSCRREVEAQRILRADLRALSAPAPSEALTARLLGLPAPGVAPRPLDVSGVRPVSWRVGSTRPGDQRPESLHRSGRRPASGRPMESRRRHTWDRRLVGATLVAVGLGGALALGGPRQTGPTAPLDPTSPSFVVEHVSTVTPVRPVLPAGAAIVGTGR